MATILLSAAGAAAGAVTGGAFAGLSSVVIGRAAGATLGQLIDQRLLGQGAEAVETGRVDRFRLTGAREGTAVPVQWGRMRVAGQVIWASRFTEHKTSSGGGSGKGGAPRPQTTSYSYSVSLALALGEGVCSRIGRIWADGAEIAPDDLTLRFYPGDAQQLPDPTIAAIEGAGAAPAYRGTAYVVIEDLDLAPYGNRVPQLSFELFRPAQPAVPAGPGRPADLVQGVALIPGTGEYALATTPVRFSEGPGVSRTANVNTPSGKSDLETALDALRGEVPNCRSVSLVVSWFGTDLRAGQCRLEPRVEQTAADGQDMAWQVSGQGRAGAVPVSRRDDRPAFGGTPADASVIEAIRAIRDGGQEVMFYPFILMDVPEGNALPDPWTGADSQPVYPWRGRITLAAAPGRDGTPDGTAAAEAEVAALFGSAAPGDFTRTADGVAYHGPAEWSYRRFILHYAHLCVAAGGVETFCIGSEMRSLTQIRGPGNSFPAVAALRSLARDVRTILGAGPRIGYAADWSEYFGYHPADGSGDVFFHLDPLWADAAIDFIGIDNYMPLSDWREGSDHADAAHGAIYDLGYLAGNVAGGEGYDWFYESDAARAAQIRTPITDGAHGEPWVFRYKDILNWWRNPHHDRVGGVRAATPTAWVPESKPVLFTEIGCPAVDKGTNQPNVFVDPKSSESALPRFSDGRRDDLIQLQYLRALYAHWGDPARNPDSSVYGGPMVDMSRAHVWAWDARPWPAFPNARALWTDGENYARGHWVSGRIASETLDDVVAEICERSGMADHDTARLHGILRGYAQAETDTARAALQPLMLAHGFDAVERDGIIRFANRDAVADAVLDPATLAVAGDLPGGIETARLPEAETAGRVRLSYVEADDAYAARAAEAVFPGEESHAVAGTELPLALTGAEARGIVERWLAESRVARDTLRFALPPSDAALGAGDVVAHGTGAAAALYRIDRVEDAGARQCEAVRVEPTLFRPSDAVEEMPAVRPFSVAGPVFPLFLDLPLLTGAEVPHAPHIAVTATPWPGSVAVYDAPEDAGYSLNRLIERGATLGVTETPLHRADPSVWDRGAALRLRVYGGTLSSAGTAQVLNGANAAAIGSGSGGDWEIFQFTEARLVGDGLYALSLRLRGQLGTDAVMPEEWPPGSYVVLLDSAPVQIDLAPAARDLARHFRIGPAQRGYDDPVYHHEQRAFRGNGLRPYAPVHLRAARAGDGALDISWIRRSRIDGDSWASTEVPLGEAQEAYLLRVTRDGTILREAETAVPGWRYDAAARAADGIAPVTVEVAQISDRFGPGPFARMVIDE